MKFRYKKYSPQVLRPVIPIEVVYKNIAVPYEILVDSGADSNIFDAQIAEILGLDLFSGKQAAVAGVTGVEEPIYIHTIDLLIGGHLLKNLEVGFLKSMGRLGYGVVGQKGFFDIFVVKFDLKKEIVELKPR